MTRADREEFRVEGLAEPLSHYTDAVRFGDLLFISGIAPLDRDGRVVAPGDTVGQTEFILQALATVLARAGATVADVLKVTVFLTDVSDRSAINPARQRFFGSARPASTLVEVSRLAVDGMKIEIEAVVGLPGKPKSEDGP